MSEEKKKRPVSRSREAFKARRKERARAKKTKKGSVKAVGAGMAAAVVISIGGYIYQAGAYTDTYFPNTTVNGMEVGGKTVGEVKEMIASEAASYRLFLSMRQGETAQIFGNEIGLLAEFDGSLEEILRQQDPYSWPLYLLRGPEYDIKALISYDETQLAAAVSKLSQSDPEAAEAPADAVISEYEEGKGYSILPESEGARLNQERTLKAAEEAICGLLPELDLDQAGCYEAPAVRSDDPVLRKRLEQMNRFAFMSVTYTFGSRREILDGKTISQWISYDENDQPVIDEEQLAAYVKALGSEYNTAYTKRKFKTSYGPEVEVAGVYGWRIDGAGEKARLKEEILAGEPVEREPVYLQTAASREGNDYGTTYAEVNLMAQHLFFYKDGKKILESDFVSGNQSKGYTTPPGLFSLTYKQRDAVLKGEGYASPVKFWMPFNGGIGFHDASWRNTFGGTIYKKNGSHGCVNMPYEAAKTLYENVYKGMPVICYNLEGTERSTAGSASGRAEPPASASPTAVPETVPQTVPQTPPETEPPVQTAPLQPAETVPETPQETQPPKPSEEIYGSGSTQSTQNPETGAAGPGVTESTGKPSSNEADPGADTPKTTSPNDVIIQPVGR
ncbi:L,D-transpeptidase family protein [Enterocloster sp.]|uniref:L,D-transpeptidase family protein n=1 Tax=Enterocloster sp. TaxID=2719315 RepID=UPI003AF0E8AA